MLPPRLLKLTHYTLSVVLILHMVLAAVPTPAYAREVAHAAIPEPASPAAAGPGYPSVSPARPLAVADVPPVTQARVEESLRTAPIMFIEHDKQPVMPASGKGRAQKTFQVQGAGGSIWLAPDAMWVTLLEPPAEQTMEERLRRGPERLEAMEARANEPIEGVNLKISFEGANPNPRIEGFDRLDTTVSYFIGSDPDQWRADVPVWGGVRYTNLYPDIDLVVSSQDGAWDWKLEVKGNGNQASEPGLLPKLLSFDSFLADPIPNDLWSSPSPLEAVKLRIEGAEGLDVLSTGEFALQPAVGIATQVGDYVLPLLEVVGEEPDPTAVADVAGEVVEAPFAEAAKPKMMASPPQAGADDLVYSTYLGGDGTEYTYGIAVDATGAAYVTGYTWSTDFLPTPGVFQTPLVEGNTDVFVTKISVDGGSRVYSARFGNDWFNVGADIAVDGSGAAYLVGQTAGDDFPLKNPIQSYGGDDDVFVTKLNPDGDELDYSTYLGGSAYEGGDFYLAIALDASGAAYVTGHTYSEDFPRVNPLQPNCLVSYNPQAFVAKLDPSGSALVYSTCMGSTNQTSYGIDIAVDASQAAYVLNYSSTGDPSNPDPRGVYVTKLAPSGNSALYSTYVGQIGDTGGIAVDPSGSAFVTGHAGPAVFQNPSRAYGGGSYDAFVARLDPIDGNLVYASYIGGR